MQASFCAHSLGFTFCMLWMHSLLRKHSTLQLMASIYIVGCPLSHCTTCIYIVASQLCTFPLRLQLLSLTQACCTGVPLAFCSKNVDGFPAVLYINLSRSLAWTSRRDVLQPTEGALLRFWFWSADNSYRHERSNREKYDNVILYERDMLIRLLVSKVCNW